MSVPPAVFALAHLAILLAVMGLAALSGRRARTGVWRHRGIDYHRLTTDEVLRRLNGPPRRRR